MKLFENKLKELYWSEKTLIKVIKKMIGSVRSEKLNDVLSDHLTETEKQVLRIEYIFKIIEKKAVPKKYEVMCSVIKEAVLTIDKREPGNRYDAAINSAIKIIELHEISSYREICEIAKNLRLIIAVEFLEVTLKMEEAVYEKLSVMTFNEVNIETECGIETGAY